jgi:hypothetical protein
MKRIVLLTLAVCGCGGSGAGGVEQMAEEVEVARPADSLVLQVGAIQVWFTDAREVQSKSGESCLERALEIREDTVRRHIPLLYSLEAPTPLDDTTMRAVLYNSCEPVATYRVDYATASPRRMESR